MAFFNYATKEITLKVVYYGPSLSGKTTNLQYLYSVLDPASRGKFISLATEADRTLFFDFLPVDIGKIRDFSIRYQLYTVPGQIRYNATRKLVLKGADAVVFVADSQPEMREQNVESYENMKENLLSNGIDPESIPVVLQFNKRDLQNVLTIDDLNRELNKGGYQYLEAEAMNGKGVQETFRIITRTLLKNISQKHKVDISPTKDEAIAVKIREKSAFDMSEVFPEQPSKELAETKALIETAPVTSRRTSPAVPLTADEKLNRILESLEGIARSLSGMRETLSYISEEMRESKKRESEIIDTLTDMKIEIAMAKLKKRWFFF